MWFMEDYFATRSAFDAFNNSVRPFYAKFEKGSNHHWRATSNVIEDLDEYDVSGYSLADLEMGEGLHTWSLTELDSAAVTGNSTSRPHVRVIAVREPLFERASQSWSHV